MDEFRYVLQIDEEGFPLFDGIRIDDEAFLRELYENFYRFDSGNVNSALMTRCNGENILVDAFESPLVAQSIEKFTPVQSQWVFPGGWIQTVKHADLSVDNWNRVRAQVGSLQVNATLSRKAQAEFGKLWSALSSPPSFAKWYQADSAKPVETASFWESTYREQKDGWEMKECSPVVQKEFGKFIEAHPLIGEECAVLGAGRGHEAAWIAERSKMKVVAIDFAESAEREFHRVYPRSKVRFVVEDVFNYLASSPEKLGLIVEHTFFCAIDPEVRAKYFQAVCRALKPGGTLMGIFWMRPSRNGPPFGLTQWELRELSTSHSLDIVDWHLSRDSWKSRMGQEYFVLLRKRV